MAVIYSKLGGCLGDTTKLGPLARTDLCAGVNGLLERLMSHWGLGSSREDPWGSLLGRLGVRLTSWVPVLSAWEAVLFPWEAWRPLCLAECLGFWPAWPSNLVACLTYGRLLPTWEEFSPAGEGECLPGRLGKPLNYFLPHGEGEHWPACFLPWGEGEYLPGKPGMLLNCFLPPGEGECLP